MIEPPYVNFAEIKRRRESLGLTLQVAGEQAGRPAERARQWWHEIEAGKNQDPQISTLLKIATVLACSISDLLVRPPPRRVSRARSARSSQNRSSSSGSAGSSSRPA